MDFNLLRKRNSLFDTPGDIGNYPLVDPTAMARPPVPGQQDITAPPGPQVPTDQLATPTSTQPSKFSDTYSDLANQSGGPAFKKYNDFLNSSSPQRDDPAYKPGKIQRLSAILAGVSDGVRYGGGAGAESARKILDDKYNEAQSDYKLQGDKLATSAGLEEKDMGRRVGILKDIIADERNKTAEAETVRSHKANEAAAAERAKRTGVHYETTIDPHSGKKTTSVIGPEGTKIGDIDLGLGSLTPDEKVTNAGKTAGAQFDATKKGRIEVAKAGIQERGAQARDTLDHKFGNLQEFLQWKQDNGIGSHYVGHRNKDGKLVMINNMDATDSYVTGTDFDTMSDADKQKAKIELKETPGADTTRKTTSKVSGNTKTTTTTTSHPSNETVKPIPGNTAMEAVSTDGGKTWKARAKK